MMKFRPEVLHDLFLPSDTTTHNTNNLLTPASPPFTEPHCQLVSLRHDETDKIRPPLSSKLVIMGYLDNADVLARQVIAAYECQDNNRKVIHQYIGVKAAYKASHNLASIDIDIQAKFHKIVGSLRENECVGLCSVDKYKRCCLLVPDDGDLLDSCHIYCFNVKEWLPDGQINGLRPAFDNASTDGEIGESASVSEPTALWKPPTEDDGMETVFNPVSSVPTQEGSLKRKRIADNKNDDGDNFHADEDAAAADAFYSGLTREKGSRADSRLYHMRNFNGWVKATQISELNPKTKIKGAMRVLDLACGKGGDLGKWNIHPRGVTTYVGVDVARGSLKDAAIRVMKMKSGVMKKVSFCCADLGADVVGRKQKILTWSLNAATKQQSEPQFQKVIGGGIQPSDTFDVVSIQFAIHYMMSSRKRARRFFKTVGDLLDIGGNLIATTIDARVAVMLLMGKGIDLFNLEDTDDPVTVSVGNGACQLKFDAKVVRKIFSMNISQNEDIENCFGLQYTFTLTEGKNHAAGHGEAVDLPEWLTPIPVLKALANEAGLEIESVENFHEFFSNRSDPAEHYEAHNALYNMHVLDRNGSISTDEWEISRMYMAIKFKKVRENTIELDEDVEDNEGKDIELNAKKAALVPMAFMKAKKIAGEKWSTYSQEEKQNLMEEQLRSI